MIGSALSHYQITGKLGAGGMGEVYLATDTRLDRRVAIKLLPTEFTKDQDRLRRFTQEAKAASALNHPNIITIHEIGDIDGAYYLVSEYIEGQTLRQRMTANRLSLGEILDIAPQIAGALSTAHTAGIIHRDIKPENVMVRTDGIVKVLDFGLAKLIEPTAPIDAEAATLAKVTTAPGTVMGTPQYMSPEQARGQIVDARADLFSLGAVLYEMIAGQPPFGGLNPVEVISEILKSQPPPLSEFADDAPAELQRIVNKTLRKDREQRYQTARDLLSDLKDLKDELSIASKLNLATSGASQRPTATTASRGGDPRTSDAGSAVSASSADDLLKTVKRHRAAVSIVLILFVLVGAGLIYRFAWRTEPVIVHFQNMKLTRVTSEGNVESATVSPDGKYIAYSLEESGKRSLWTKHLGTGSRVQIVPPTETFGLNASTFSHDGYVYYTRVDEQNPLGSLFQVPVLGGTPKKILANVAQPVSLSPDGKQLAFGRYHLAGTKDEIWLANVDGTGERLLVTVEEPEWFGGASAGWSPDGKMLAVGYGNESRAKLNRQNLGMTLAVISVADGTLKLITSQRWLYVGNVSWFSDGSGLALISREQVLGPPQIWQVSYSDGTARRVTNDLNSYDFYSLSMTADAGALISVQSDPFSNIWVAPGGDASRARAITTGKNVQAGHYGLSWTPDGKLIFDSNVNGNASIWTVNADGSDPKPLTDSASDDFAAEVSPDGRTLVFLSGRSNMYQVWRSDIDGTNHRQLTEGSSGQTPTFSISPDGRWVICHPFVGGIRKIPIEGGSSVEIIAKGSLRSPQVSPDGKLLAYFLNDDQTKKPKIAIVTFDGGAPVRTLDLPVTSGASLYESGFSLLYHMFHWSADGQGLIYINTLGGVSNLWRQPLDGSTPKLITDFKSDLILNFAYSRDGRNLAVARASQVSDAVMINEVK